MAAGSGPAGDAQAYAGRRRVGRRTVPAALEGTIRSRAAAYLLWRTRAGRGLPLYGRGSAKVSSDDNNDSAIDRQTRRLAAIGALRRLRRLVDGENEAEGERQRFAVLITRIAAGVLVALGAAGLLADLARGEASGSGFRLVLIGVIAIGALLLAVTLLARKR